MFKSPDILHFSRSAPSSAQLSEKVHSIESAHYLPIGPLFSSAQITKIGLHADNGSILYSVDEHYVSFLHCMPFSRAQSVQNLKIYSRSSRN